MARRRTVNDRHIESALWMMAWLRTADAADSLSETPTARLRLRKERRRSDRREISLLGSEVGAAVLIG